MPEVRERIRLLDLHWDSAVIQLNYHHLPMAPSETAAAFFPRVPDSGNDAAEITPLSSLTHNFAYNLTNSYTVSGPCSVGHFSPLPILRRP